MPPGAGSPEDRAEDGEGGTARRGGGHATTRPVTARALVVVPVITRRPRSDAEDGQGGRPRLQRSPAARLEEAIGLAAAIDLDAVYSEIVTLAEPRPATLLGAGKVEELAAIVKDRHAELVVVDHPLSPVQQRNLEKQLDAKVLDRTGIILEIFGRRARTREGTLQVDLAHLEYQRGRLVRSWTHLERQRGGGGFMGGPGETQIEADRRLLQDRIVKLKRELEQVRRTRELHRSKRRKVPYPIVALVGYTNAGKSTLFNRLTGASVMAEDMLFATLDPTLRRLKLPHGTDAILSDTVGFISDLPTHLVAAFRATLEEVLEADLIVHLRDISDPDTAAQAQDVETILRELGVEPDDRTRVIEVWNKVDLLTAEERESLASNRTGDVPIAISAVTGDGIDRLLDLVETRISGSFETASVVVPAHSASQIDWIYRHAQVTARKDRNDGAVSLTIRAPAAAVEEIRARLARKPEEGSGDD